MNPRVDRSVTLVTITGFVSSSSCFEKCEKPSGAHMSTLHADKVHIVVGIFALSLEFDADSFAN